MTKTYIIDRLELVFVRQVDRCSELVLCGLSLNKVRCCHPDNNIFNQVLNIDTIREDLMKSTYTIELNGLMIFVVASR